MKRQDTEMYLHLLNHIIPCYNLVIVIDLGFVAAKNGL